MRYRVLAPALVVVGVLVSAWPLQELFTGAPWLGPLFVLLVGSAAAGGFLRAAGLSPGAVLLVQLGIGLLVLGFAFGADTLVFGLIPGPATFTRFADLLEAAGATVRDHPAPAPAHAGIGMLLAAAIGLLGVLADVLAVGCHRPALAGLTLLAPLLVAVANSDGALSPRYFVLTAAVWLALLALADRESVTQWTEPVAPRGSPEELGLRRDHGAGALGMGVVAVVLALVVAATVPHLPVRYLAEGLGRGGGSGTGTVGFSPDQNILADLTNTDTSPILVYRTDDPDPAPLRVGSSSRYIGGRWLPDRDRPATSNRPRLAFPPGLTSSVPRETRTVVVSENYMAAPHLAAPYPVVRGSVTGARWGVSPSTGVVAVQEAPASYEMSYLELNPRPQDFAPSEEAFSAAHEDRDTAAVTPLIARTAERVAGNADSAYAQALAIQDWLRGDGGFTYSLQLPPRPEGMNDRDAARTAVDRFLQTKQGYCVQFSSAMILMARHLGLPARMGVGFLPGTAEGSGPDAERVVTAADAHAWPEIYFEGIGWLRFEPTPGARSGTPPAYAPERAEAPQATPGATPSASSAAPTPTDAAATPPSGQRPELDSESDASAAEGPAAAGDFAWWIVPLVLLLAAAGALMLLPLAARRHRRRHLAAMRADADRVEAQWNGLLDRLADLGLRVDPTLTLPAQETWLARQALLDPEPAAALHRCVEAVEAARYAPVCPVSSISDDAAVVVAAARQARGRGERLRAALWPAAGRRAVASWWRSRGRHQAPDRTPAGRR